MGLYDVKKTIEAAYYKYCIKEGRLPLPDTVYYLWDKKKIERSLMQNKERSPRKEKKKKKKPKYEMHIALLDAQGRHRSEWCYAAYDGRKDRLRIPHGSGHPI